MKKTVKTIIALSLALVMLLALVSCDKSGSVKKTFEENGYTVTTKSADDSDVKRLLKILYSEEQIKEMKDYEIMLCTMEGALNVGKIAIIVKFPDAKALKASLTVEDKDGKKDTSAYDNAKESGIINGNCMILTFSSDSKEVFKKA